MRLSSSGTCGTLDPAGNVNDDVGLTHELLSTVFRVGDSAALESRESTDVLDWL
jgi:hypothetical protein